MDASEKALHEAFVTSKGSCDPLELLLVGGLLMYSTVLHATLAQLPPIKTLRKNIWFSASLAIFVQCVPFILSFTILADYWACLVFTVVALAFGIRLSQRLFDQCTSTKSQGKKLVRKSLKNVCKAVRGSVALVILGMVRLFMVTVLNYQNPVHEYGVHWNFFFTLASTRILTSLVYATVPIHMDWVIAVALGCVYEACLLFTPLALFLDSDDRSGFLAANKEGLASIAGYVALHLAAAATARTLGYKPRNTARDWIRTGLQATGASGAAFVATYIMHTAVDPVSRRLANVSYCLWMYSLGTFALAMSVVVTFLRVALLPRDAHIDYNLFAVANTDNSDVDILWKSINYNGMAVFLLANILTGLVNVFFHPRTATDTVCVVTLVGYIYAVCMFAVILHRKRMKLKLPFT
ncbi:phosphatidylinositol-glycan biosynthesis class W protein isoform X3 [Rhipicephalus sanguineus]|uniref:phosphatidylinositol-glycan biosynthesis class W protein isoform X3 n=1 Tax=Rhipicephalus sanguineus TaxID=34632 RepID=UPI001893C2D4|nr:phosphatidylinositol-glycan biosynthesis class W protein isoform X3 [Rhipicephalus sanguineus]